MEFRSLSCVNAGLWSIHNYDYDFDYDYDNFGIV